MDAFVSDAGTDEFGKGYATKVALCEVHKRSHSPSLLLIIMKRSVAYGAVLIILASAWAYMKISSAHFSDRVNWFTNVSPWYFLIVFGCYCLAKLGFDLLTFNDYPHEIKKLEQVRSML